MGFEIGIILAGIAIVTVIFVGFVSIAYLASRYKKVGPNEVLVISGRRHTRVDPETGGKEKVGFRLVRGGGAVILPVVERVDALSLELMTIEVRTEDVYTVEGVPVIVDGVAQVKVASDDIALATAAERFLSKSRVDIEHVAHETLAGHLRAILGTLTVEEIYKDRDAFAQQVQQVSASDLRNMGLGIDSFVIKDIRDEQGYLDALGQARLAQVKRDAAIGQAIAARDATIKSAEARQEGETAKYIAETKIAEANKNYLVQKAAYDAETNRRRAEAELAYVLQQNITNQEVKEQEVQIEVVAKKKQIEVQEQEVLRKERELEATVRKPAEAERHRVQTLAEAEKFKTLTQAEGQASAIRSVGEGEAGAVRAKGLAEAEIVQAQGLAGAEVARAQGLAGAEVTQAQGFAEAEAMLKKAHAWQQYNEAAILQQLIEALPQVAGAIAEPLTKVDRMVVISSGGDGAGASRITRDVVDMVAQVPATLEAITGVNLAETLKGLPGIIGGSESRRPASEQPEEETEE